MMKKINLAESTLLVISVIGAVYFYLLYAEARNMQNLLTEAMENSTTESSILFRNQRQGYENQ